MSDSTLRVAIVGSGPAGLYAAAELLRRDPAVLVDLFERLPTPGGLVRSGVSPDHGARRKVVSAYERIIVSSGRFRLFGNVALGSDVPLADLRSHYHAVLHASGASSDRRLGIPGEDLPGSHAATELVGWYNGHPDFASRHFDLSCDRAVIVGNGNVALDVARMLLLPVERLRTTDTAPHALDALAGARVREVVILGRRGPAQAAFTAPELLELAELPDVDVIVESPADLQAGTLTPMHELRVKILREFAQRGTAGRPKRLVLRFLHAPLAIEGDTRVRALRVTRNELRRDGDGLWKAHATGPETRIETGLVFRSIGYRAEPVDGLPFDDRAHVVPNLEGRVIDPRSQQPMPGAYVAGWLKRGPSGVIGTNKRCSQQTVAVLLADAAGGKLPPPTAADPAALDALLASRGATIVDYRGWRNIDRAERRAGTQEGRPRVKLCAVEALLTAAR